MNIERCTKESFTVIGREGSTRDGDSFIQSLWAAANEHFGEIAHLVKKDKTGTPAGFWGAMSDFSRSFHPWENNFSEGLYLAGAECQDDAEAPAGWTKWRIPSFEYLKIGDADFSAALQYMEANDLTLVGAVHDFTDPATGQNSMFFPIRKI